MINLELDTVENCDLCNGTQFKELYKKPDTRYFLSEDEFTVVKCIKCGFAFVNPRPSMKSMEKFYPQEFYEGRQASIDYHKKRYEREAEFLKHMRKGKLLDIGCAEGTFLEFIKQRGWDVYGMDFSKKIKNKNDLKIQYGDLPSIGYQSDYFDVVTSWAVFEHLHSPMKYFREVHRILKTDGVLILLVTNLRSIGSRFAYKEDIPRHMSFFSKDTLVLYAKKAGFNVERIIFSNKIYDLGSRGVFRVRMLRFFNVSWKEIYKPLPSLRDKLFNRPNNSFFLWCVDKIGYLLGLLLFWPFLEKFFGRSGIMIGVLKKNDNIL